MRATILSCMASGLLASNAVAKGAAPARAVDSCDSASTARVMIVASSLSNTCVPVAMVTILSASEQAGEPYTGDFVADRATAPPEPTWYCTADWPDMNTALPETLTQVNVARALLDRNRSPMRPPQPEVAPSGSDDCHTDCWSLCENSLGGSGTLRALNWALVVGCIRVPTLSSTPRRPASNSSLRPLHPGAKAICRPLGSATLGTRGSSVSCGSTMPVRMAW